MSLSSRLLDANLSHFQFRLFVTLWSLATSDGVVEQSMDTLGCSTQAKSRNTVREAIRALEDKGLLETQRKKRGRGFYSGNTYQLLCPLWEASVCPAERASTDRADSNYDYLVNRLLVPNSHISQTSYENIKIHKVSEESMNKSWREEQAKDDSIGGIGKLESETPRTPPSKKDTKTRGLRPEAEWTSRDVAAEFSYLVGKKFPWLPGTVNVGHLAGALAKQRNQYQTTALVELELLKMFMADQKNFIGIGNEAPYLYKKFLQMFKTHLVKAHNNLGIVLPNVEGVSEEINPDVVYASDGRTFDNTIAGRSALERYEKKLNA